LGLIEGFHLRVTGIVTSIHPWINVRVWMRRIRGKTNAGTREPRGCNNYCTRHQALISTGR
jgi:hypothetical protein